MVSVPLRAGRQGRRARGPALAEPGLPRSGPEPASGLSLRPWRPADLGPLRSQPGVWAGCRDRASCPVTARRLRLRSPCEQLRARTPRLPRMCGDPGEGHQGTLCLGLPGSCVRAAVFCGSPGPSVYPGVRRGRRFFQVFQMFGKQGLKCMTLLPPIFLGVTIVPEFPVPSGTP